MDYANQLNKCRSFLKRHDAGILASSTPDGEPHASLVNYLIDDDLKIYFMAREGAHKYANITANPPACLVVCEAKLASTIEVKGHARKVRDGSHTNAMLTKLAAAIKHNNPGPLPILHHPGSEIFLFEFEPRSLTYADFYTSHNSDGEFFEIHL